MNLYENLDSYIRDTSDKWLVAEKKQLYAKKIQVGNVSYKEKFTISFYVYSDKPSVTIKLTNSDLYLSCQCKKLALTVNPADNLLKLRNMNLIIVTHLSGGDFVRSMYIPCRPSAETWDVKYNVYNMLITILSVMLQMNEKDPENTNKMFLFHVHKTGQVTCAFAPATDPQFFISTSKSNTSLVTVQPKSANTYIMEFVVPVLENIQI